MFVHKWYGSYSLKDLDTLFSWSLVILPISEFITSCSGRRIARLYECAGRATVMPIRQTFLGFGLREKCVWKPLPCEAVLLTFGENVNVK